MIGAVLWAVTAFALSPAVAYSCARLTRFPVKSRRFFSSWTCSCGGALTAEVLQREWPMGAGSTASLLLALLLWWLWSRRKRRRGALKAPGGRARARLAAMVRNMPKPGPALRPVPQGRPA